MQLFGESQIRKNNSEWIKTALLYEERSFEDDIYNIIDSNEISVFNDLFIYSLNEKLNKYANSPDTLLQQYSIDQEDNNKIEIKCLVIPDEIKTITITTILK